MWLTIDPQETSPMYDYRLFFPSGPRDEGSRPMRVPTAGAGPDRRVYRVDLPRRSNRDGGRR